MNPPDGLVVAIAGTNAARISRDSGGRLTLRYDADYLGDPAAVPLSLSLPLDDCVYGHRPAQRWLDGLLPDNPQVLAHWYERENVSPPTPFGLLATPAGLDCAGAVQFATPAEAHVLAGRAGGLTPVAPGDLESEIAQMAADSARWLPDDEDAYYSLGGYQTKTALRLADDGQWARPRGGTPTTHILKPSPASRPEAAAIEHLCQATASRLGLPAAASALAVIGSHPTAIITRYDRVRAADGAWHRVHQEDMCQALGENPNRKFEKHGGPGAIAIADLLWRHSTDPDTDVRRFRDAILYTWATVNRDAHARNYSIVHQPGAVRLAPLYDTGSALPRARKGIGRLELAMRIGDDHTIYRSDAAGALTGLAARLGLPAVELLDRAGEIAETAPAALQAEISALPHGLPAEAAEAAEAFHRRIERRAGNCLKAIAANRRTLKPAPRPVEPDAPSTGQRDAAKRDRILAAHRRDPEAAFKQIAADTGASESYTARVIRENRRR